ncbi:hypothetical protein B484DRAFT_415582 [Ochromonadaceae sp. CCMP2298]|nr:hypothetical protein B484DRAFT_415582 [Ochromonadaceae sp. CCMP2298]
MGSTRTLCAIAVLLCLQLSHQALPAAPTHVHAVAPTILPSPSPIMELWGEELDPTEALLNRLEESLPLFDFGQSLAALLKDGNELVLQNIYATYLDRLRDHYYGQFLARVGACTLRVQFEQQGREVVAECLAAMRAAVPIESDRERDDGEPAETETVTISETVGQADGGVAVADAVLADVLDEAAVAAVEAVVGADTYTGAAAAVYFEGAVAAVHFEGADASGSGGSGGGGLWSYEGHLQELRSDIDHYLENIPIDVEAVRQLPRWRTSKWFRGGKWAAVQALMLVFNFGNYEMQRRLSIRAANKRLAAVPEFPLL